MSAIANRYDFVLLFDVTNGNPNGDPDNGNLPRTDFGTGMGIVTNNCIKRKIRNYVELVKNDEPGFRNYIKQGCPLNRSDSEIIGYLGIEDLAEAKKSDPDLDKKLRDAMCWNFYDIRTFGAVMTTFSKYNLGCSQLRGPVQITDARSIDPIMPQLLTITRQAVTTEKDAEVKKNEMGNRYIVPYGLYRAHGFISANIAQKDSQFSEEDLQLLWEAIVNMFEHDRSSARGEMVVRELIVFKHDSMLGNYPAHKLFEAVKVTRNEGVKVARAYSDYTCAIDESAIPGTVMCSRMI